MKIVKQNSRKSSVVRKFPFILFTLVILVALTLFFYGNAFRSKSYAETITQTWTINETDYTTSSLDPVSDAGVGTSWNTSFSGTISTDTVWSQNILVTGDVNVNAGVTLTINPGVTVFFAALSNDNVTHGISGKSGIYVTGRLIAEGTSVQPIYFTSNAVNKQKGDWYMIQILGQSADSSIKWAKFRYAEYGVYVYNFNAIREHVIDYCSFKNNSYGVQETGGAGYPVSVQARVNGYIKNSYFEANDYGILLYTGNGYGNDITNTLVENNYFRSNGVGLGMSLNSWWLGYITISSTTQYNTFETNTTGILLEIQTPGDNSGAHGLINPNINHNYFKDNTTGIRTRYYGDGHLLLPSMIAATITENVFNSAPGIVVQWGNPVLSNNNFTDDRSNGSGSTNSNYTISNKVEVDVPKLVRWGAVTEVATKPSGSEIYYQFCTSQISECNVSGGWKYWNGTFWLQATNYTTTITAASELTEAVMNQLDQGERKISFRAILIPNPSQELPTLTSLSMSILIDTLAPTENASNVRMFLSGNNSELVANAWVNNKGIKFTWTPGSDDLTDPGIKGYCLYLGTAEDGNPELSKGILSDTSPVLTKFTTCQYIVSAPEVSFVDIESAVSPLPVNHLSLTTQSGPYYLNVRAVDYAGNVFNDSAHLAHFQFRFDSVLPNNVKSISTPGSVFANVADMSFSWPVGTEAAATDDDSDVLGYQYQINSLDANGWKGTTYDSTLEIDYIPKLINSYLLTEAQDGASVNLGDNTIYFRTIDIAGNVSTPETYRTANLLFGGNAPTFGVGEQVTVSPTASIDNDYSLSWNPAIPAFSHTIAGYYYMVNTPPPNSEATLKSNPSTYISVGTSTTVSNVVLPNVNQGSNVVYVVAVDEAGNYSPSNRISGAFRLDSTNPDPVKNLTASDASVKEQAIWRASLAWDVPDYKGTGILTYIVQRSTNGIAWTETTRTTGNSVVDTVPTSAVYFWRVGTIDTSQNSIDNPSFTNGVSLLPKGKFVGPADLVSGPDAREVSTKRALISWVTSRNSDSRVKYGLEPGRYLAEEIGSSDQVTTHDVRLLNLEPATRYYYVVTWTDEDGNIGSSEEQNFITNPAPQIIDAKETEIGLYYATITFKVKGASRVKVLYGKSNSYGAESTVNTSSEESVYSVRLTNLDDGTLYHYKMQVMDGDGNWFSNFTDQIFTTIEAPKVTNIAIQGVKNTSTSTVQISWSTNTATSSVLEYYEEGVGRKSKFQNDTKLVKGEHKILVSGLLSETSYMFFITAKDIYGNLAVSDVQHFTTSMDTRPPVIADLAAEGEVSAIADANDSTGVQLVVSWTTDEPATTQVEFAEGASSAYTSKTFEDKILTTEHIVILPNLLPSHVYHLRVISHDKAGNETISYDVVTVTPKTSESALELIFQNLRGIFSR